MATYFIGLNFTGKAFEKIKEAPSRIEAARKMFHQSGAEIREYYLVLGGHYDAVILAQAPNDEAIAKAVMQADAMGTATSQTCRAFGEDEFRRLLSSLP